MRTGQLELHCQPTVDCSDGSLQGAEALIRWRRRDGSFMPTREWVPLAEGPALRNRFNLHVLNLAAQHQRAWNARGVHIPLGVNVTPACLADDAFVEDVERMFAGTWPERIRLEITERTTAINSHALKANVERLRSLGFHFLLDDFGAGYSSLERLSMLSVSTLKIDRSLISDITRRAPHRAIVESVIPLAHALGLDVICEGVEDAKTWAALQGLGCDRVQGFHVSRPMPAERFPFFAQHYRPTPPQELPLSTISFERRLADRRAAGAQDVA